MTVSNAFQRRRMNICSEERIFFRGTERKEDASWDLDTNRITPISLLWSVFKRDPLLRENSVYFMTIMASSTTSNAETAKLKIAKL